MATQNQWSMFGDLSNQRTVMMSGSTGPAPGQVASVVRYSTGNLSTAPYTSNSFNVNIVNAASDPKLRSVVQVMLPPGIAVDANGNLQIQGSRITSGFGIRATSNQYQLGT